MKKYDISSEYALCSKFVLPFNKFVFFIARILLGCSFREIDVDNLKVSKVNLRVKDDKNINLYIFEPKNINTDKVLLYIHGGGFVFKGNFKHYSNCKRYAVEGNCKVVYVDYRLAPKYKYPIPIDDCFEAYKWVIKNSSNLKIDPNKIIVGGDSAGGCLALDITFKVIDEKLNKPKYLMLIYPLLDKTMNTTSMKKYVDTPVWNAKLNKKMWKYYLNGEKYISPNEIRYLKDVPSVYMETAEFDCLHDEAIEFTEKLTKAGVDVVLNETKRTIHGFDIINCPTTEAAIVERINVLNSI